MSTGENTGTIGRGARGDVLQRFKDSVPGPGAYFDYMVKPSQQSRALPRIDDSFVRQTKKIKTSQSISNGKQ